MAITIKNNAISNIVISTFMGHSGDRIFDIPPLITNLFPGYRKLRRVIKESGATVIAKSSTFEKHRGNFQPHNPLTFKYIRRFGDDGMLNAYGLTNDGVEINAQKIASAINNGFKVIPSFYPQFAKGRDYAIAETLLAIEVYAYYLGASFRILEFNFSCPNSEEKIRENMKDALACVKAVKQSYPNLCLIAKISILHPPEFAPQLVDAGADIIHAINTIPHNLICPNGPPSPLAAVGGGGVSGGPAFSLAFNYNKALRRLISVPMIMGCGVTRLGDAKLYFDSGANAVSLCTVCRVNPDEAIEIIRNFE